MICLGCGEEMAAQEYPSCTNSACREFGVVRTAEPLYVNSSAALPGHQRAVQAYKAGDGSTHETLNAAIERDVTVLFCDLIAGPDNTTASIADALTSSNPTARVRLMRLLEELK